MKVCWLASASAIVGLLAGCTPSKVVVDQPLNPSHENLMKIGSAYTRYTSQNKKPPKNEQELSAVLKDAGKPEELLRSPADGEPYVICWGVDVMAAPTWAKSVPVLAYEKNGSAGKRYVLTTMQSVVEMTEEEFRQASFPPGHPAPR